MAAGDALLSGPDKLYTGSKDETVKSLGFPVWTGKMVLLYCQFSALSCVDFTVPFLCRQNGKTITSIWKSSDFASFLALYMCVCFHFNHH
ncbi:PREDICTED: uncharacterized protein LOC105112355 isoform X1 [Populus euphratica]|uniref:Uncharacterized protein LOC105112355 isoform X1 n=1 Tax=Populus euphratica TaxID=75702 RepID=A0AAJ6T7V0_POPEU|nr:PREDICTED: uncharacterized protein LOC105112355 isoform X1 [Populus euphratica]